ncbi:PREDICTED: uncharacterized protein LOC105569311 isoform X2 [Vollenhovia emeryi]|uniref:uncharacterized protein LOC105569311 isoform X2 n=1 Tax=Vollenhovia emeryi TaxID=411798 RepID=UPI0005F434D5|nr:PREDICTED: uncharacterized protein LOC105569311 isoform X2 [Vollenhovia emeryi]
MDLERQRINHRKMLEDIIKRYKKHVVAIDGIDKRCNEYATSTNARYEQKQIVICKAWEYERNEMQAAMGNVIDDLEFLKDVNTKLGRAICERKWTIKSNLLAIITKYDTEIGSRYRTLKNLSEVYKRDKLEKHDLEREIKQQGKVYRVFIERREKTGITYFYKSLVIFKRARSARIIQRWWRQIFWARRGKEEFEREKKEYNISSYNN